MMCFLDTNVCIYLLKGTFPELRKKLLETKPEDIKISSIVYGELLVGAKSSGEPEKSRSAVMAFVSQFEIVPFDKASAEAYSGIRSDLLNTGLKGGANDMIIAATAFSRNGVIVTNNEKDFDRFTGVQIENWVKQSFHND
jgi:tRNA(fMet)-specific endonuclease VapC